MTTEAAKRAADALNKRREAEGMKRVTVWLSAEARFKLDALKKAAGSKDRVADAAILAWNGPKARLASLLPPSLQQGKVTEQARHVADLTKANPKAKILNPPPAKSEFRPHPKPGKRK